MPQVRFKGGLLWSGLFSFIFGFWGAFDVGCSAVWMVVGGCFCYRFGTACVVERVTMPVLRLTMLTIITAAGPISATIIVAPRAYTSDPPK